MAMVNGVDPPADWGARPGGRAEKTAGGPPLALRLDKQALDRAASTDLAGALEIEAFSQALAVASDDHQEGVAAFFDKRPPKFTGQCRSAPRDSLGGSPTGPSHAAAAVLVRGRRGRVTASRAA